MDLHLPGDHAICGVAPVNWPTESWTTLQEQRWSCRDFTPRPLTTDCLLDMIVPAFQTPSGRPAYAIPGAIPSITVTVLANRVDCPAGISLEQGIYNVSVQLRTLSCLRLAPFKQVSHCVDMTDVSEPAAVLLLCLHLTRRSQYVNAYELGFLEAGQLLQNLSLAAASMGIGACILGSVIDKTFRSALADCQGNPASVRQHGVPIVAIALGHSTVNRNKK